MLINREQLVRRHNPKLDGISTESPLSVGNGNFAFTMDITGMQSLYAHYLEGGFPLCTQSQWGWHTAPAGKDNDAYTLKDLEFTEYSCFGRTVRYPVREVPGNEAVYHWLRQNPHRLNLGRIGLMLDGKELKTEQLSGISQELDLWTGVVTSRFSLDGSWVEVKTAADPSRDALAFGIRSPLAKCGRLSVLIDFPYGSPEMSASDFDRRDAHETAVSAGDGAVLFERRLDGDRYVCSVSVDGERILALPSVRGDAPALIPAEDALRHRYELLLPEMEECGVLFAFAKNRETLNRFPAAGTEKLFSDSSAGWEYYWKKTGMIDLEGSTDPRADELERRIILSQYLLAIQSSGSLPPQETGLTCNSWYGKFHLEMYFWHEAYLPLWGRTDLLERSLPWFLEHLPEARANAAVNGYRGARWPKMVGPEAADSPSVIAPLLIWQQPHLLYMLYLAWKDTSDDGILRKYYPLIRESADFMADFAVKNREGFYELLPPLIPVQECHPAQDTRNPVFELEYWVVGLKIAIRFAERLNEPVPEPWREVSGHMILPVTDKEGCYRAHSGCAETYGRYAVDHPSFLMAWGMIDSGRTDPQAMERSLEKCLEVWDESTLWGWDFAVMAMTAVRLGRPDFAVDLILRDSMKNRYVASGNNRQESRSDLPLYLPGNGSLLFAAAMMAAGYEGCDRPHPGFPEKGFCVRSEGIRPLPAI